MLRHNETLLVILVVLSMIVQSALAHNNGVTIAQADVELNRLGNASELQVRAVGKGTLEEVGDFNHLQGSIHEIDIYLHVWIAEVFPENSVIVVFKYSLLFDRQLFHLPDTRNSLSPKPLNGKKTLAGTCLRGGATSDVRIQYKLGSTVISESHSPDHKVKCYCPGDVVCPDEAGAQAFTQAQHQAIKQELRDIATMADDPDVIGAFNVNGRVFLQRADTPYVYTAGDASVTIGELDAQAVQINLEDGVESAFVDIIPAAPPAPNYTPKRTAVTWGKLKKG